MFNIPENRLLFEKNLSASWQYVLSTQVEHLMQISFRYDVHKDTEFFASHGESGSS